MSDNRPYLEIPIPSEDPRFKEWLKNKKEDDEEGDDENERVVIINV